MLIIPTNNISYMSNHEQIPNTNKSWYEHIYYLLRKMCKQTLWMILWFLPFHDEKNAFFNKRPQNFKDATKFFIPIKFWELLNKLQEGSVTSHLLDGFTLRMDKVNNKIRFKSKNENSCSIHHFHCY